MAAAGRDQDILLKGGLVVDGTGAAPYAANLLIRQGKIARITPRPVRTAGVVIDCSSRVVAPGFIDAHSHLDWHVPLKGHDELKYPFLAQGITTLVAGASGLSAAGFRESSTWKEKLQALPAASLLTPQWDTVDDYLQRLEASGSSQNIALLAGHGSTRISIRGFDPSPLHPYETKELLWLLEHAMEQGARGVSIGLQYEPGTHARPEEIREVALVVKKKGRVLVVHPRAFAPSAKGDALTAVTEVIGIARTTGVRLQISRLMFCGPRAGHNAEAAVAAIDAARKAGVDVGFGVTPYHCAATILAVLLPAWFLARGASGYGDASAVRRLKRELHTAERRLGFALADIQVTNAIDTELAEYNGRLLTDIARLRRMSPVDTLIDLSRRSAGQARVLVQRTGTDRIVEILLHHHAALYTTDAWVERFGVQNPAAYAAFPRLLEMAREHKLLRLEEAVHKMTGAAAERFSLHGRGTLAEGLPADITVFDWDTVGDSAGTEKKPKAGAQAPAAAVPRGIDYVFVNGKKIIGSGKKENPLSAGVPLR
jgi:N-acyl-D-amino-acid deacylase